MEILFDCIIVGAGLAGLAASEVLSRNGLKTLTIEQGGNAGGYAVNFNRGKYRFEASLHSTSKRFFTILHDELNLNIKPIQIDGIVEIINKEGVTKVFATVESISSFLLDEYPREKENINIFFKEMLNIAPLILDVAKYSNPITLLLKNPKYFTKLPALAKWLNKTMQDLLDHYFETKEIKRRIFMLIAFLVADPDALSAIVSIASMMDQFINGNFYPSGGSGAITTQLVNKVVKNGGLIEFNSPVTQIKRNNRQSYQLSCGDEPGRERILKAKAIIYCADLINLITSIMPSPRENRFLTRPVTRSLFNTWVGLNVDLSKKYELARIEIEDFSFNTYSNIDASCCEPGHSIVTITDPFVRYEPFHQAFIQDGMQRGKSYYSLKKQITQSHVNRFLSLTKIDSNMVDIIESASPLTHQRLTRNQSGSIMGFELNNDLIFNPIPKEINGVHIAGQWRTGGYEFSLMSGIEAAKDVMGEIA